MIARSHFTRFADKHGVDAKTVERDYVLTHVLAAICRQPDNRGMIFKGGTALRLCYFEDYRYSADLDFSLVAGTTVERGLKIVGAALDDTAEQAGFPHLAVAGDGKRIEYVGPLGRQRDLKLDIAADELVEDATTRALLVRYTDQVDARATVYTLEETAAEKLRCVIQRLQARDLYDLNELLVTNGVDVETVWPAFERKAHHKDIDPERFAASFEKRVPQWKSRWVEEMSEHVPGELPPFNSVERAVRRALRAQLSDG